ELGITVSDEQVISHIRANPLFYNEKGAFDAALFEQGLRSLGTNEKAFVTKIKHDIATDALARTFAGLPLVSVNTTNLLYAMHEEQRAADAYVIARDTVKTLAAPDDAALQAFYKDHAALFTSPEYRTLSYLTLSVEDAQRNMKVSDQAIEAAYKERID